MEEVQKNEPGRQPEKEKKPKRELSPKEVQRRRKMIVFPLMFLAFAGCMYLIFAPSGKEKAETESVGGFNADIPLPAEDGIIADKQTAYEQAMMSRKRQDRIQSLQDFGFIGDDETEEPQAEAELMPEEDPKPVRGGGASSSATAYRDINRQLSTFYETPPEDREKEDLKRQVAELTEKLERQREATPTADEQMAIGKVIRACRQICRRRQAGGTSASRGRHRKEAGNGVRAGSTGKRRFRAATAHERCRFYPCLQPPTQLRFQHGGRNGLRNGQEHDSRLHPSRPDADGRAGGKTPSA